MLLLGKKKLPPTQHSGARGGIRKRSCSHWQGRPPWLAGTHWTTSAPAVSYTPFHWSAPSWCGGVSVSTASYPPAPEEEKLSTSVPVESLFIKVLSILWSTSFIRCTKWLLQQVYKFLCIKYTQIKAPISYAITIQIKGDLSSNTLLTQTSITILT